MSFAFGHVPRLIWGCGDGRYGDRDAKKKAKAYMRKVDFVFVNESYVREYEKHYACKIIVPGTPEVWLWRCGFKAVAVPSSVAIKILGDFKLGHFDGFMLRDYNLVSEEDRRHFRVGGITDEHLILDLDGVLYTNGLRTDHYYD